MEPKSEVCVYVPILEMEKGKDQVHGKRISASLTMLGAELQAQDEQLCLAKPLKRGGCKEEHFQVVPKRKNCELFKTTHRVIKNQPRCSVIEEKMMESFCDATKKA